jgi:hypothetical protein
VINKRRIKMKRLLYLLTIAAVLFPLNVFAQTYTLKDFSLNFDDSSWYVFTRDNIKDNEELNDLGVSYDYINDFMNTNDIYMDAFILDEENTDNNIELFVAVKEVKNVNNLHTYSSSKIDELGESLKDKLNADKYDVYSVGKYKFIHVNYYDSVNNFNIDEYYTVINGYGYSVLLQKVNSISDEEHNELKEIIDTADFKIDSAYEVKSSENNIWDSAIIGAIVGAIIYCVTALINKFKNKNKENKKKDIEK